MSAAERSARWRAKNLDKARGYSRRWKANNPEIAAAHSKKSREGLVRQGRAILHEHKNVPCADCGVRYPPYVMDFDHRDGSTKVDNVGSLVGRVNVSKLLAEIEKCDVVCANCHRERTYGEIVKCA